MDEDAGFIEALTADPSNITTRLIYADWLDDHDSPLAPYVRAECDLLTLPPGDPRFGDRLDRLETIVRATGVPLGGWEHVPALEQLKTYMASRIERDPHCKAYGAYQHRYRLSPPLAEVELLGLERRLGFLLPSEYRAFVLRVCNGPIGPGYGLEPLVPLNAPASLFEPCLLTDADAAAVVKEWQLADDPKWPDLPDITQGSLDLSHTSCGNTYLVLTGQQRGKVWTAGVEFTAPDIQYGDFTPLGFFSWYEQWLGEYCPRQNEQPSSD